MKTGKEIKADVLAMLAQTGDRSREKASRLYMQAVEKEKGLTAFDGDATKQRRRYWNSKVETCFFTDDVDGGCKLTWLRIGERKKRNDNKTIRKAQWYQVVSVEPYDMSKAQWDEDNLHLRKLMSAVAHGKQDPNAAILDSLDDNQRENMERIYYDMKDFLFMHPTKVIEQSERLKKQWEQWQEELNAIDPRIHFNLIDYVYESINPNDNDVL